MEKQILYPSCLCIHEPACALTGMNLDVIIVPQSHLWLYRQCTNNRPIKIHQISLFQKQCCSIHPSQYWTSPWHYGLSGKLLSLHPDKVWNRLNTTERLSKPTIARYTTESYPAISKMAQISFSIISWFGCVTGFRNGALGASYNISTLLTYDS